MRIALIGNPNCGKTALFNRLTGANQHVGNYPGVTVEAKEGGLRAHADCRVVDLPGVYSLRTYSAEERISRDFLLDGAPDGVINLVDVTCLGRGLYLTLQVIELGIPAVLALNMMDDLHAGGGSVDTQALSEALGIPVIPVSAAKNQGIQALADSILRVVRTDKRPKKQVLSDGALGQCIGQVNALIADRAKSAGLPLAFAASRLIEGERPIADRLALSTRERESVERCVVRLEEQVGADRAVASAGTRYAFIDRVCADVLTVPKRPARARSAAIDRVLTGKILAYPLFLLIMGLVFYLTFSVLGPWGQDLAERGVQAVTDAADRLLLDLGVHPALRSLISDGIFAGVGSVLSFLPVIVVLFFFLSVLEDSGYMARVAFIMDRPLRLIGLSGKSIVPLLLGFGCSVPAIMASRTLSCDRDRKMTLLLVPYMSCSAKLPIYAMFAGAFFASAPGLLIVELYLLGIVFAILASAVFSKTAFRGKSAPFLLELPDYRLPSPGSVFRLMLRKAKEFLQKAFTVIFLASVVIWVLRSFDPRFHLTADGEQSMLALIGKQALPLFAPLGFERWEICCALITGLTAKEAVLSTLSVLSGGAALTALFADRIAVFSFLIFTLLYTPCVAAFAALRRELGSLSKALGVALMQCAVAYAAAGVFYQIACMVV